MPPEITPRDEKACLIGHSETKERLLNLEWWNEEAVADIFNEIDSYEEFARYAYSKLKQAEAGETTDIEKRCIKGYPETKQRLLDTDRWSEDEDAMFNVQDLFGGSFGFIDFTQCARDEINRQQNNDENSD